MKSNYEEYGNDPLKYVKNLLGDADRHYDELTGRIERSMRAQVGESKAIDLRRGDANIRSSVYLPVQYRAISSMVDTQMALFLQGDPMVRGTASYDQRMHPLLQEEADAAANRVEDYYALSISSRYGEISKEMERFFHTTGYFPYGVMRLFFEKIKRDVPVRFKKEPIFDENDIQIGERQIPVWGRRLSFAYPKFQALAPWECRLDLRPRNWSQGWEYFFTLDGMSSDQLQKTVHAWGGDEGKLKKMLDNYPAGTSWDSEKPDYGKMSLDTIFETKKQPYRLVTGYIRLFNPEDGYEQIRVVKFIDGVRDEYALMYEAPYKYSSDDPPFMVSFNNLLIGEAFGLSDADVTAVLQDEANESWNLARDAARLGIYPSTLMVDDGWVTEPSSMPWSKWKINLQRAGIQSLDQAARPIQYNASPRDEVLLMGAAEERLNSLIGFDAIAGRVGLPERKTQTLGQDQMRLEASTRRIARITGRHINSFERLLNTSLDMFRREVLEYIKPIDFRYCEQELRSIGESPQDLLWNISLGLPHVRMLSSREDMYLKVVGLVEESVKIMPHFITGNPQIAIELLRKLWEAADMKGFDKIFEGAKNMQSGMMPGMEQQTNNRISPEVLNA